MQIITKENIIEYLASHMEEFDPSTVTEVSVIGEGSPEDDGDGYVNFIFRVHTKNKNYIVKQGLENARVSEQKMELYRTKLEYDSMKIHYAITPEYLPDLYYYDDENNLFVTEDVSYLGISRFQFAKNVMYESFGKLCGDYMAKNEFYTSEYYLDRADYRKLQQQFENTPLRKIMEDGMFLDRFWVEAFDESLGKGFVDFAEQMTNDERYITELFKLRRSYMSHADALIHADMHTSNIFAADQEVKVIDFEFSFMGPFGYDLGYLAGNLISQYCASCFKVFPSEEKRLEHKAYLLATLKSMFRSYFLSFTECWNQDSKQRYRARTEFRRAIFDEIMVEAPGYASMVNWFRAASPIAYPDFDVIEDVNDRRLATTLSLLIDWEIMFARYSYRCVDDLVDTILYVENAFMKMIK